MNKKLSFYLILLALSIVIVLLFVYTRYSVDQQSERVVSPTSTSPSTTVNEIREPVDVFEGEQNNYSDPQFADRIFNETLGTLYGFTRYPDLGGTGGDIWSLHGIQKEPPPWKITYQSDQFGAAARALASFSPDNRYLAFRTRWNYGIADYDFRFMVFDLVSGQTITVGAPSPMKDVLQNEQSLYLESYEWRDNTIQMIWYPLTPEKVGDDIQLFRTTPKQLWRYDLQTQEYTFVKALEE